MEQPIRVVSAINSRLFADAIPGHFATNHSHINYYIDMSQLRHSQSLASEAARTLSTYFSGTSVDTVMCLEGTEYIGAYLARELSHGSLGAMNDDKDIYLVEPESGVNGQLIFADNLRPMLDGRDVLVLVGTASTGQTLRQAQECAEYYGGHVTGFAALFANIDSLDGTRVVHLFNGASFPHYHNCVGAKDCPDCLAGRPLDAIVTPHGYTRL